MTDPFTSFAAYYDELYRDKAYEDECDFLEEAFTAVTHDPVESVLDCACGTASHAIPMAERGYDVFGFDVSPEMLRHGAWKAQKRGVEVPMAVMDFRSLETNTTFDAGICMFHALGYLTGNDDVSTGLSAIRDQLEPGAPFVFDFWNGLAVRADEPHERLKRVETDDHVLLRYVEPEVDWIEHVCTSHYTLYVIEGDAIVDEHEESHTMRYFFPKEIEHFLSEHGFALRELRPFPGDAPSLADAWNLAAVAEAV